MFEDSGSSAICGAPDIVSWPKRSFVFPKPAEIRDSRRRDGRQAFQATQAVEISKWPSREQIAILSQIVGSVQTVESPFRGQISQARLQLYDKDGEVPIPFA